MAEKEKKRKRQGDVDKSSKRRSIGDGDIQIAYEHNLGKLCPVIASAPGTNLRSASFDSYSKQDTKGGSDKHPRPRTHSLLLHSSDHAQLDYHVRAETNPNIDHYLGVFDPSTNTLKVVPAHTASVRSTLRSETAQVQAENAVRSRAQQREDLGLEFGTKKAKRAITSKTVNAITGDSARGVEAAILDSVNDTSTALPEKTQRDNIILESKPIPRPNLDASRPEEVYPLHVLVPQGDLRAQLVKDWQDKAKADEAVEVSSRFVASRMAKIANGGNVQKLKALKYLLLLLEFNAVLKSGRSGKKVPPRDQLKEKLSSWPEAVVENVRRRFAEGGELNKWHVDNMMTHMAAISLYIDGWRSDTHDLREDLRLENKEMSKYFHELGCSIRGPTEQEYAEFKISNKAQAAQRRVVQLKIPLDFPKTRNPPRRR